MSPHGGNCLLPPPPVTRGGFLLWLVEPPCLWAQTRLFWPRVWVHGGVSFPFPVCLFVCLNLERMHGTSVFHRCHRLRRAAGEDLDSVQKCDGLFDVCPTSSVGCLSPLENYLSRCLARSHADARRRLSLKLLTSAAVRLHKHARTRVQNTTGRHGSCRLLTAAIKDFSMSENHAAQK